MKVYYYGIVAVAGLTIAANAGSSRLQIQVSKNGTVWSNHVDVDHAAGDSGRVLVRYSMSWVPEVTDTAVPVGLAAVVFQPIFANVRGSDVIAPFVAWGNNTNGGSVTLDSSPLDGPFGRLRPYAATGPAVTNAPEHGNRYFVHTHNLGLAGAPPGRHYRIARNDITRWMGTGPSVGSTAINNFNGAGGVAIFQKGSRNVTENDPPFNPSIQDIILFQIAIDVGAVGSSQSHAINLDVPLAGAGGRNSTTGLREASWFGSATDSFGPVKGVIVIVPAQITIVPAPSSFAFLALGAAVTRCRRRTGLG